MSWQPNSGAAIARARSAMINRARQYFAEQAVLEVTTPVLSRNGVTDPNIGSLKVSSGDNSLYLQTSPEYFMKRLIAAGYPDIFQVCPVFRGGEVGRRHLPEFTMLEWYRLGFDLDKIIADAIALTMRLLGKFDLPPKIIRYNEVFQDTLAIDPGAVSVDELADSLDADDRLRHSVGDDLDAWLDLAIATRVSSGFEADRLTVITHYPASQAALARLSPGDASVADRFEIYWGAVELANGFVELIDADEQLRRFNVDRDHRRSRGLPDVSIDSDLIEALRSGMPDCAGVALGLDRTLMIAEERNDIRDVTTFTPGLTDGGAHED